MNFADEEYVRLYVADTVTWRVLPWEARAVLVLALRKFDHAGVFEFGRHGAERALTAAIDMPVELVSKGLSAILAEDIWVLQADRLFWPKFIEAQNCKRSDRLRKRLSRARVADPTDEENRDTQSQSEAKRDEVSRITPVESRNVTECHVSQEVSHLVTPGRGRGRQGEGEAGRERHSGSGSRSENSSRPGGSYAGETPAAPETTSVQVSTGARRFAESLNTTAPDEIEFTAAHQAFAREHGIKIRDSWLACRDHRRAKQYRCADWGAEFMSWLRKEPKFSRAPPGGKRPGPPQPNDETNRYRPPIFGETDP